MGKGKHKQLRNKRKLDKMKNRTGMTRPEWAKFKKEHNLPKIVKGNDWKKLK
jgi:hypothetical protein